MATNGRQAAGGRQALVLGGGGLLGVAWEAGVLSGMQEAGADPAQADLIVGTSAGSIVGTQLATGLTVAEILAQQFEPREGGIETVMEFDVANLMSLFQKWSSLPEVTQQVCAEIGAMALASKTVSEERWLASFEQYVGDEWPERPLLLTTVDAETGEFRVWDRDSGVPLRLAVASSCAVPGLFPPVHINGRAYVDGGVRSGTSADLATGYETVAVIAPIGSRGEGIDPLLGRQAKAEAEALRAARSRVELLFPDADALAAIGVNRMDGSRRAQSAEAGVAQGTALGQRLRGLWERAAA
ncbi:MAG: patatin-like phospholipase family protein [Chloroflexi bacterium]|nr:MAG: patatin-like phospholipase family protein [Chloroflexota bacterium]